MESLAAMGEAEWNSFSGMYSTEEADFMAQLLGNCASELPGSSSRGGPSSAFWAGHHKSPMNMPGIDEGLIYSSNMYCFSQESSYSGGDDGGPGGSVLFPSLDQESYYQLSDSHQVLLTNNSSMSLDFGLRSDKNTGSPVQVFTSNLLEGIECMNKNTGENLLLKSEPEIPTPEPTSKHKNNHPSENSKKRSRVSGDKKSSIKPKKKQKLALFSNNAKDNNAGPNRQSSSSCCSEDESNTSQELNRGGVSSLSSKEVSALNLDGNSRASRGSATDPQSLYARKRRERINERLRILQTLVPNGTKVDISTMLEEAVQYVKFLQLQIKLLSSDDLWMYSPIAYNGMDLGLDLKMNIAR